MLDSETNDAEKPGQGFKRLLQKLKEEDKEHKAGRIEYISYDEANKRTGYDRYGWLSKKKQKEEVEEQRKGVKRFVTSLFLVV